MSEVFTSPIYMVRIPEGLAHVFEQYDDTSVPLAAVCNLKDLTNHLPLEDVFYFAYEQTSDNGFVNFVTKYQLSTILQTPENIAWLAEVKTQYESYIRRREDLLKINPVDVTNVLPVFSTHEIYHTAQYPERLLIALRATQPTVDNPQQKRLDLFARLMKFMGFDTLRRHTIVRGLLAQ